MPVALAFMFCAIIDWPSGDVVAGDMDLDHIRSAISLRDSAVRNLNVHATFNDRRRFNSLRGAAFISQTQIADIVLDTSQGASLAFGRVRMDLRVEAEGPEDQGVPIRILSVSSPEGSRTLEPFPDRPDKLCGRISRSPGAGLRYMIDPTSLLSLNRASISHYLGPTQSVRIVGEERIGDHLTTRVEWVIEHEPGRPTDSGRRGNFWLAPALGFAPVLVRFERRPTPDSPWREIDRFESRDFAEVDGLWLPGEVVAVLHKYYDDLYYELEQECTVSFSEWRVNGDLADPFMLDFPDGTWVLDEVRGKTYLKGAINDGAIEKVLAKGARLAASDVRPTPEMLAEFRKARAENRSVGYQWSTWPRTLAIAIAALSGLILAFITITRVNRRRSETRP